VNWSQVWLFVADWLTVHGLPTMAGFIGGLVGAEVRLRWSRRKGNTDADSDDR